jgi:hypothetical protein
VEWLRPSGSAPSDPSETPQWLITRHQALIPCFVFRIAHWSQCNLFPPFFHVNLEERRNKVRTYETTRPWGSTQLRESTKSQQEQVRPKVGIDRVCIWVEWEDVMKMRCSLSTPGSSEYILRITHSTSVVPRSQYTHCRFSTIDMEGMIDLVWRCTWRQGPSELRDALGSRDRSSLEMHWEAVIERVWRCTWRPGCSKLRDALGGCDGASLWKHLQALIERYWRITWRWLIWREARQQLRLYWVVNL